MSNDLVIGLISKVPTNSPISTKPSYLIYLEYTGGKSKVLKRFITLDKPEFLNGFIQAKGVFSELPEEEIINNYSQVLTTTSKELIVEMLFPWHKVSGIRSLIFKAK